MNRLGWQSCLLALAVAAGCRCGDGDLQPVAHVGALGGEVERTASPDRPWLAAAAGDGVYIGGAVRTGEASNARIDLARGGGTLSLGPLSLVRFARTEGESFQLDLQTGEAEIETGSVTIVLATPGGALRLVSGTRARAVQRGDGLDIEIIVGSAEIEAEGAAVTSLSAGDAVSVRASGVARRPREPEKPDTVDDAVRIEVPGGTFVSRRASEADVSVPAGESATLHAPAVPVAVRVQFGTLCPAAGLLEVAKRTSFSTLADSVEGKDNAIVTLGKGTHRYRVRCIVDDAFDDSAAATGRLVVVRDDSTVPIPKSAPRNEVDADGRKYTVLFQNAKPRITFRWPRASEAKGYVLHLRDKRDKVKTFKRKKPTITVRPGELGEGTYEWWIEAAGSGSTRSPITTLRIDFDNAAPAASIRRPKPGADWSGATVRVEGTALRGSTVTADGVDLPLDRHYRFKADIAPPEGGNAIAVRIAHRAGGVHYYVRRRGRK